MNKAGAIAAIQASFDRGSSTPCSWASDRAAYIAEQSETLLACAVEPFPVAVAAQTFDHGVLASLVGKMVYAVARADSDVLLYVPELDLFSKGWGHADDITILGFGSSDALAEWLG